MSSYSNHPSSSNELVLSTNSSSGPLSLPDDSSTSHDPCRNLEVESVTGILYKKQGDSWAQDENEYVTTINILPDDVLLDIFDFCRQDPNFTWFLVWGPHGLVHVCQRWRRLVFGSPRRLELQLPCTRGTPVKQILGCWPPLPVTIFFSDINGFIPDDEDSLFAALKPPNRAVMAMQHQFPALTHLALEWDDDDYPTLPSGFLGGSAPYLQYMHLNGVPFTELLILLSSTSDLVHLYLNDIPQDGHISTEALVTCLAALPRFEPLHIGCEFVTFHPDQIRPPPVTRTLLPALHCFEFWGDGKYMAGLVYRIDCPRLNQIHIKYSRWPLDFQLAQLFQFIDRSEDPMLTLIKHTYVSISHHQVYLEMHPVHLRTGSCLDRGLITVLTQYPDIDSEPSYLIQLFGQPSALFSRVAHLKLFRHRANDYQGDEWLHVLRRFSALRTLEVSGKLTEDIAYTLERIAEEMDADVLPVLDSIHIGDQPVSCIEKFLAVRRLSGRPVTIVETRAEFNERVESYVSE
ncbi:hypothetical protein V8E53_006471 [Lactarius tabidus]